MDMQAEIISFGIDSYQGKRGQVNLPMLTLLDRSPGVKLRNTVDFMLEETQAAKLPSHENSKLAGKAVRVAINDISAGFGGRMRLKGDLVEFDGKPLPAANGGK